MRQAGLLESIDPDVWRQHWVVDVKRMLVWFYLGWCFVLARQSPPEPLLKPPVLCRDCGSEMQRVAITSATGAILWQRGQAFIDSS